MPGATRTPKDVDASSAPKRGSLVAEVVGLLDEDPSLGLEQLAERTGRSPSSLQRTFRQEMGVSPHRYAVAVRAERLQDGLEAGQGVAESIYAAGYQSSSVAYDQAASVLGMTPRRFADGGAGERVACCTVETDLGPVALAATTRGIVAARFDDGTLADELRSRLPKAEVIEDSALLSAEAAAVLAAVAGHGVPASVGVDVEATAFQARVWATLRSIPLGERRSYGEVAAAIGEPTAARAVARACATNPVALIIPCHRVVRTDGSLSGYRWGVGRKQALLERERAAPSASSPGARGR